MAFVDPTPQPPQQVQARTPTERVVFAQALEALVKSCGAHPDPKWLQAFADAGIDLKRKLPIAVPYEQYIELLQRLATARFPDAPDQEKFTLIGRAFMEGYRETMMGRALMALIAVLGPKRMLLQATRSFRSANNYSEVRSTELAPKHFSLVITPARHPGWYIGLLTSGLAIAGAKNVRMELKSHVNEEAVFEIRWD
jgi:uncharacterized protein (TIGR02265 family)